MVQDFIVTVRQCLQPLAERGFTFWDGSDGRAVHFDCDRGDLGIRVWYETYDAPFCEIRDRGRFVRRIEVVSEFTTGEALALAGLPEPPHLAAKHVQEIEAWCMRIFEDEKIAA
jgi:hypothetical protein